MKAATLTLWNLAHGYLPKKEYLPGTLWDMYMYIPYFLEYLPQVLLISMYPRMWVQFEGGNKARVGSINIATLLHSYTHGASNSFSTNKWENLYMMVINRPKLALLYDQATVWSRYEQFQQVMLYAEALVEWLNHKTLSHSHPINCAHMQCGNYSRVGFILFNLSQTTIQGREKFKEYSNFACECIKLCTCMIWFREVCVLCVLLVIM